MMNTDVFQRCCGNCKYADLDSLRFYEDHLMCTHSKLSWFGSADEYGFFPAPDFMCKFWEARDEDT